MVGGTEAATLAMECEPFSSKGCVVVAHGQIDLYSAPSFKEALASAIDGGNVDLVVDLSDVSFMDSTGLGALVGAHKRLDLLGGSLVVVSPDATIKRVFELVGLSRRFEVLAARPTG